MSQNISTELPLYTAYYLRENAYLIYTVAKPKIVHRVQLFSTID